MALSRRLSANSRTVTHFTTCTAPILPFAPCILTLGLCLSPFPRYIPSTAPYTVPPALTCAPRPGPRHGALPPPFDAASHPPSHAPTNAASRGPTMAPTEPAILAATCAPSLAAFFIASLPATRSACRVASSAPSSHPAIRILRCISCFRPARAGGPDKPAARAAGRLTPESARPSSSLLAPVLALRPRYSCSCLCLHHIRALARDFRSLRFRALSDGALPVAGLAGGPTRAAGRRARRREGRQRPR
jgi:hypothetical protein